MEHVHSFPFMSAFAPIGAILFLVSGFLEVIPLGCLIYSKHSSTEPVWTATNAFLLFHQNHTRLFQEEKPLAFIASCGCVAGSWAARFGWGHGIHLPLSYVPLIKCSPSWAHRLRFHLWTARKHHMHTPVPFRANKNAWILSMTQAKIPWACWSLMGEKLSSFSFVYLRNLTTAFIKWIFRCWKEGLVVRSTCCSCVEDLGLVLSICMVVHNNLYLSSMRPNSSSEPHGYQVIRWHTSIQAKYSYT